MIANETINQLFVELVKLFVSGFLGGITSLWLFRAQRKFDTKRELQLKRLDASRDINLVLHWLYRDIFYNWEKPINKEQSPEEYMFDFMNRINYWETLFLTDQEMSETLKKLNSPVGASRESFHGEGKIFQKPLGEMIDEIRSSVKQKIVEMEKSITK